MNAWVFEPMAEFVKRLRANAKARQQQPSDTSDRDEILNALDRAKIEAEFALHAAAVSEQVSAFADVLAGDDVLLRARLRRIEHAGGWS